MSNIDTKTLIIAVSAAVCAAAIVYYIGRNRKEGLGGGHGGGGGRGGGGGGYHGGGGGGRGGGRGGGSPRGGSPGRGGHHPGGWRGDRRNKWWAGPDYSSGDGYGYWPWYYDFMYDPFYYVPVDMKKVGSDDPCDCFGKYKDLIDTGAKKEDAQKVLERCIENTGKGQC